MNKFSLNIVTMFGIGYSKYIPGTAASFVTCLIFFALIELDFSIQKYKIYLVLFVILIFLYSVACIDKLSKNFKEKDAKEIVIDEFVGQCIPLLALLYPKFIMNFDVPIYTKYFYSWIVLSFFLFRFFDTVKPFPINMIDKKMKNGLGVMLDDIIAGIYTTIVIYIIYALWF